MNLSKNLVRKIIYILIIVFLIFPLAMIGRPSGGSGQKGGAGGILAQMRDEHGLSQAKLSEIDAGSESMKLISLGMRGIATNILWTQANEAQKKGDYDTLRATLQSLIMIQPTFVSVWRYQAHNLSYNISVEFDDYQQRFYWVKEGIVFLTGGIKYNRRDHRIMDTLGFFSGNKIGMADEKKQFRQLFRFDKDFHNALEPWHDVDSYNTPHNHDNWLLAYLWYGKSESMVDKGVDGEQVQLRIQEPIYYSKKPLQIRQQAMGLHREIGADNYTQELWENSSKEWLQYGLRPFRAGAIRNMTMERIADLGDEIELMQKELDSLVPPGTRDQVTAEVYKNANVAQLPTEEEDRARKLSIDQRTPEERILAQKALDKIVGLNKTIFVEIANKATPENIAEAKKVANEIYDIYSRRLTSMRYGNIVNYKFWKQRAEAEQRKDAVAARRSIFEGKELYREGKLEEWQQRDADGNAIDEKQKGAIQYFLDGFAQWKKVLDAIPDLNNGPLSDEIADDIVLFYTKVLAKTQRDWPDDFPLQDLIDKRNVNNEKDGLPTTEMLERERSLRGENSDGEQSGHVPSDLPPSPVNK